MSKFVKKGGGDTPSISTASLPDIIFMILMFFMVSVSMRQTDRKVMVSLPGASEVAKLERKDLACYIYIGTPTLQYQSLYGTESQIQLNDAFRSSVASDTGIRPIFPTFRHVCRPRGCRS